MGREVESKDVRRIRSLCKSMKVNLTLQECENLWFAYSDMFGADWVRCPLDDADLWQSIEVFLMSGNYEIR